MPKFIYNIVQKARVQSVNHAGWLSNQEIAGMVGTVSVELFWQFLGKPSGLHNGRSAPTIAYQVSTQVDRALNPFLKVARYGPGIGAGMIASPADMVHPTAFTVTGARWPVDVLDDNQVVYGVNDEAFGPDKDYPKAEVLPGGYQIYPPLGATGRASIKYLALPPIPTYVETYNTDGVAVYDDTASVDVGWGRQHEPELLERTLRLIAQATKDNQLAQTSAALTQDNT